MGRELRETLEKGVRHWAVHETVSEVEGAITPGFATKTELVEHLVTEGTDWDGQWSRAAAEHFVNRTGWGPSFVIGWQGVKTGYEEVGETTQKRGTDELTAR